MENTIGSWSIGYLSLEMPEAGMMGIGLLNPARHVGYWIDNNFGTFDTGGGALEGVNDLDCKKVSIKENISPSLAIEKLSCFDDKFKPQMYDILNFNCGGYTRKIGNATGLTVPQLPNIGIGDTLFFKFKQRPEIISKSMVPAEKYCENLIVRMQEVMEKVSNGNLSKEVGTELTSLYENAYFDFKLQVILLSAMDSENQLGLREYFSNEDNTGGILGDFGLVRHYVKPDGSFHSKPARKSIKNMLQGIEPEKLDSLKSFVFAEYYKPHEWATFIDVLKSLQSSRRKDH